MFCKNVALTIQDVIEQVDESFSERLLPEMQELFEMFKEEIEREFFSSTVRFKPNHITIRVNDRVDLNRLGTIKIKNDSQTIVLQTRNIEILPER